MLDHLSACPLELVVGTGLCSTRARPSPCRTTRLATNSSLSAAVASSWRSLRSTRVAGKSIWAPSRRRLKQPWSLRRRCASTRRAPLCSQRKGRVVQKRKGSAPPHSALHLARCAPLTCLLCCASCRIDAHTPTQGPPEIFHFASKAGIMEFLKLTMGGMSDEEALARTRGIVEAAAAVPATQPAASPVVWPALVM